MMVKNILQRTVSISAFIFIFSTSYEAYSASVVNSDFEIFLPQSLLQEILSKKWQTLLKEVLKFRWQLPDKILSANGIDVHVGGLSLELITQLGNPDIVYGEASALSVRSLGLQVKINAKVSVDQIVEREIGGIIGRFRVHAECSNVELNMRPGSGELTLLGSQIVSGNQWRAVVNDAAMKLESDAVSVNSLECVGAEGFEEVISSQVARLASEAEQLFNSQKSELIAYINQYLANFNLDLDKKRQLLVARPDVKAWLSFKNYEDRGLEGMKAQGVLSVEFVNSKVDKVIDLKITDKIIPQKSLLAIYLPKNFISTMAEESFSANSWVQRVWSSKIPGFSSIMRSRFLQFFIWPALMKFPKSANFPFEIYSDKDIKVTGGNNFLFNLNAQILARMNVPRDGSYVPFMTFKLPLSSQAKMVVKNGTLKVQLSKTSLGLNAFWDQDYISRYNPSRRVATSMIRNQAQSTLLNKSLSMTLPKVPLFEGVQLVVKELEASTQSESIRIVLAVDP